ncbi:nucleotidyl transferase AbiEii/AbiGii toxin family protein [Candidatus Parcubacteria bacterium]|nr:nucleotidyl transferase AbiEii/AbiGii toxin family protein [Candidatus Parcubacteria bacterium]
MLTQESLKEFTKKYQTIEENVAREYIQHLFLSFLYKMPFSEKLLFKGGTAFRFIYQSPRFSEDLDFTGQDIYDYKIIEDLFIKSMVEIEKIGIDISLTEAKPTTGGYLGIIHYNLHSFSKDMKFEISLRKGRIGSKETDMIVNDFIPGYTIIHLPSKEIVQGKINALFARAKPRDYYDFYFILRHPELRRYVAQETFIKVKKSLEKTQINFRRELAALLPASHHLILKDFKSTLIREIEKNI